MLAQMFVQCRRARTGSPDHDETWDARHLSELPLSPHSCIIRLLSLGFNAS